MMNIEVEEYMKEVPSERRARINDIHALILALYPEAVVDMRYKMPTYTVGAGWIALANQKSYISLYTCGYQHIQEFKTKHPRMKTGRGCINFSDRDIFPLKDLREVIQHAIEDQ